MYPTVHKHKGFYSSLSHQFTICAHVKPRAIGIYRSSVVADGTIHIQHVADAPLYKSPSLFTKNHIMAYEHSLDLVTTITHTISSSYHLYQLISSNIKNQTTTSKTQKITPLYFANSLRQPRSCISIVIVKHNVYYYVQQHKDCPYRP